MLQGSLTQRGMEARREKDRGEGKERRKEEKKRKKAKKLGRDK